MVWLFQMRRTPVGADIEFTNASFIVSRWLIESELELRLRTPAPVLVTVKRY